MLRRRAPGQVRGPARPRGSRSSRPGSPGASCQARRQAWYCSAQRYRWGIPTSGPAAAYEEELSPLGSSSVGLAWWPPQGCRPVVVGWRGCSRQLARARARPVIDEAAATGSGSGGLEVWSAQLGKPGEPSGRSAAGTGDRSSPPGMRVPPQRPQLRPRGWLCYRRSHPVRCVAGILTSAAAGPARMSPGVWRRGRPGGDHRPRSTSTATSWPNYSPPECARGPVRTSSPW
jgi:hypothetical protein